MCTDKSNNNTAEEKNKRIQDSYDSPVVKSSVGRVPQIGITKERNGNKIRHSCEHIKLKRRKALSGTIYSLSRLLLTCHE